VKKCSHLYNDTSDEVGTTQLCLFDHTTLVIQSSITHQVASHTTHQVASHGRRTWQHKPTTNDAVPHCISSLASAQTLHSWCNDEVAPCTELSWHTVTQSSSEIRRRQRQSVQLTSTDALSSLMCWVCHH